ncbi:hypothetical protein M514_13173 [Trichuris suis]|uniref:Helix-turn-helix domain-containing protein n=1 Tax=Trichuris suis TaxID=68888 RepID=A0A085MUK7_9BILA|nr:hypothetical protein M514_13173 [Trichuris suis]
MTKRAIDICEPEFLGTEQHHIYKTFKNNGYPPRMVYSVIQQTLAMPTKPQGETITGTKILLPYCRGLSEKIQRLGRTLNFSVCYTRGPNLRSLLRSDKVRVLPEEHPGVVYERMDEQIVKEKYRTTTNRTSRNCSCSVVSGVRDGSSAPFTADDGTRAVPKRTPCIHCFSPTLRICGRDNTFRSRNNNREGQPIKDNSSKRPMT